MIELNLALGLGLAAGALVLSACQDETSAPALSPAGPSAPAVGTGSFAFTPVAGSATCVVNGTGERYDLPDGYSQTIVVRETQVASQTGIGASANLFDMNTLNETGPQAGRYLYRTHEVNSNGAVTRTDLWTNETVLISQDVGYRRLDGIAWTPWRTVLFAEETTGGRIFEYFPTTDAVVNRSNMGLRSHEGLRVDAHGNVYGISETTPGYVFKFVPDRRGDLSSGTSYALKVADVSKTGDAEWVELDMEGYAYDSNAAAAAAGATGWSRPEDVETNTQTGNSRGGGNTLYVAVTGEDLVLRIQLMGDEAYVSNFIEGVAGFSSPDNLALSPSGDLFVAEDPSSVPVGDDIWAAATGPDVATEVVRFASLRDCVAEGSGIYFDRDGKTLFVNVQHASWEGSDDLLVAITRD
jgi:secreted PhoX family phosphatase